MIKEKDVLKVGYFNMPHPDVPGQTITTCVTRVEGKGPDALVHHHSFDVCVPSPSKMSSFCERASYPNFYEQHK